jgi:hypothetical protein
MTKVKDITKNVKRKAHITVKSLIEKVRTKLNQERVDKVCELLETKYRELSEAKLIVSKIEKQIKELENKDINEVDLEEYEY